MLHVNVTEARIRVTEHPLEVHLLLAVRTGLFLSDDAPSSYAELMKTEGRGLRHKTKGSQWWTIYIV